MLENKNKDLIRIKQGNKTEQISYNMNELERNDNTDQAKTNLAIQY